MDFTDIAAAEQGDYWTFLSGDLESFRYAIIANCVHRLRAKSLSLFDAGCSTGILRQHLPPDLVSRYVGADIDQSALAKATLPPTDTVLHASLEEPFPTQETFDVIVFNEVLYYTRDPIATIERYLPQLRPEGWLIVSIHIKRRYWSHNNRCLRRVLRYLRRSHTIRHHVRLDVDGGQWCVAMATRKKDSLKRKIPLTGIVP